jgi:hypothetical protein
LRRFSYLSHLSILVASTFLCARQPAISTSTAAYPRVPNSNLLASPSRSTAETAPHLFLRNINFGSGGIASRIGYTFFPSVLLAPPSTVVWTRLYHHFFTYLSFWDSFIPGYTKWDIYFEIWRDKNWDLGWKFCTCAYRLCLNFLFLSTLYSVWYLERTHYVLAD